MASSKNSKTEKKRNVAESSETSKPRKEKHVEKKKKSIKKKKLSNCDVKVEKPISTESHEEEEKEEVEREEDKTEVTNGRTSGTKPKKGKVKAIKDDDGGEEAKANVFPMNRIRTIIRGQNLDLRISTEATFVINRATEKFLEQFTRDAYASCARDRKKSLAYKHLSSVVSKQSRYDFLSDFVPEKLKAEDALRVRNSGVNSD